MGGVPLPNGITSLNVLTQPVRTAAAVIANANRVVFVFIEFLIGVDD
jgi:hypothetical protein